MSDTPRTERRIITQHPKMCGCFYSSEIINADFARTLERELNAAKAEIEGMKQAIEEARNTLKRIQETDCPCETYKMPNNALTKLQPFLK